MAVTTPLINDGREQVIDRILFINQDVSYPANVLVRVANGGGFQIAAGKTLTFAGPFEAGNYQVFSGPGAVSGLAKASPAWFGALGSGADEGPALAAAGAAVKEIVIDKVITIGSDLSLPSTLAVRVANGGGFNVAAGKTLTFNGPFEAGRFQTFWGAGTVQGVSRVSGDWFGALGAGGDDAIPLAKVSLAAEIVVDRVLSINSDLTLPASLVVRIANGGGFNIAAGKTLTINGPLHAGLYRVFFGSGTVAGLGEAFSEWWAVNSVPGTTDMSPALRSAASAVSAQRGILRLAANSYGVASTVSLGRIKVCGVGDGSKLVPLIADGSPVLDTPNGTNYFYLDDFIINSGIDTNLYAAGTASAQNCIGIRFNSSGSSYSARFGCRNVRVNGCAVGWDIKGFIGSLENVWATNCDLGLRGTTMNAARVNLKCESCRQDFQISSSNGIHMDQYLTEGAVLQYGLVASTMDNVNGCVFSAPYFEQNRNVPFVNFGFTTKCTGIVINGLTLACADNAGNNYETYLLAFDKVDGLMVNGYFSTGYHSNLYSTTTNTRNILDNSTPSSAGNWGPNDASKNLNQVRNHFPNPNFDLGIKGWPSLSVTRSTLALENTIVRRGANALRISATAGQNFNYVDFVLNDLAFVVPLRGKTVTAYAWVWVPNITEYDPNATLSQTAAPTIVIGSTNAVPTTVQGNGATQANQRGCWNLMQATVAVQVDAVRIDVNIYANDSGTNATGNEYIVVDSIFLVEGDGGQTLAIKNGWITDSDLNPTRASAGGLMVQRVTAKPSSPNMTYAVGDRFEFIAPVVDGYLGEVVTTAGVGGAFVSTPYGKNETAGYQARTVGGAVASASTITPTGPIFHVTGTTAVNTINLPYTGFKGSITLIPDAAFTTGTSGNIAIASTAVVSKALTMTFDGTKWYPSY